MIFAEYKPLMWLWSEASPGGGAVAPDLRFRLDLLSISLSLCCVRDPKENSSNVDIPCYPKSQIKNLETDISSLDFVLVVCS